MRKVERAISSELEQLVSLGVSPQADLMVWQREVEEIVQRRRRELGDEDYEEVGDAWRTHPSHTTKGIEVDSPQPDKAQCSIRRCCWSEWMSFGHVCMYTGALLRQGTDVDRSVEPTQFW